MPTHPRFLAILPLAAAVAATPASAQDHPAIEGTWAEVGREADLPPIVARRGDASFRVGTMGSGWGSPLTISRLGPRLVVEYPFFSSYDLQAPLHFEFAFDGPEAQNDVTIGATRTLVLGRAAEVGDSLVIVTRQPVPPEVAPAGVMAEVRRTLSLVAPDTLRMVTTRVGIQGASSNVVATTWARRR